MDARKILAYILMYFLYKWVTWAEGVVCCSAVVFETGPSYIALAGWLDWNSNICFLSVGLKVWAVGPVFLFFVCLFIFVALGV